LKPSGSVLTPPIKNDDNFNEKSNNNTLQPPGNNNGTLLAKMSPREAFFTEWDKDYSEIEEKFRSIKRRFPGPAGLLPVMSRQETIHLSDANHPLTQKISRIISDDLYRTRNGGYDRPVNDEERELLKLSDNELKILRMNKGPWRELVKSLNLNPSDPNGLLQLMNIKWLRKTVILFLVIEFLHIYLFFYNILLFYYFSYQNMELLQKFHFLP
jgi:hypothetical protein